jgi:hypothetical protein
MYRASRLTLSLLALCAAPAAMGTTVGVTTNPTIDIYWYNGTIENPSQKYVGQVQFDVDEEGNFFVSGYTPAEGASCAEPDPYQPTFCWGADQDRITVSNANSGNLDPYFTFASGVVDFGAASIFSFVFSSPIAPTITGMADYVLDIGLTFSSTSGSPGGSIGIAAPNTLGIAEGLVNGTTLIAGTGPAAGFGGPGTVVYGPYQVSGTYDCSLVGGCTSFQSRVSFLGSGGGDAYSFSGRYEITPVPVPAAVWLFGSAVGLLGWMRRRAS